MHPGRQQTRCGSTSADVGQDVGRRAGRAATQLSVRKILNSADHVLDSLRAKREAPWTFLCIFYESASGNNQQQAGHCPSGPIEVLAAVSSKAGEGPAGAAVCPLVSLSIIRRPVAKSRSPLCPSPPSTLLPYKLPCMEIDHYDGDYMAPTMRTRGSCPTGSYLSRSWKTTQGGNYSCQDSGWHQK